MKHLDKRQVVGWIFVPVMLFEVVFGVWLLFRGGQIGPS